MESVQYENDDCISSASIYKIFMSHSYVQKWLLQTNPPSITEVAFSLSKDPVLFGFEVGDGGSVDPKFSIDTAGILAVYQCIENTALGFGFPYLGRHFSELADQQFRIEDCTTFEGCPITRFAIMRIEHLAKPCFISLEFNWSLAGSLVIFTKASYILDEDIENSFFNHFEFRWFSPENAISLCQASAKMKTSEHFDESYLNYEADIKKIYLQLPGRVIRFEHYSGGKRDDRSGLMSSSKDGTLQQSSNSIANTTDREDVSELDISNSAPMPRRSVWSMYQTNFLSYHGTQRTFSSSVQRRRRSFLGMSSVLKENCIYRLNVSAHIVMNKNLENLFRVLKINSSCVTIDQYLVGNIPTKSRTEICPNNGNWNESDVHNLPNNMDQNSNNRTTNNINVGYDNRDAKRNETSQNGSRKEMSNEKFLERRDTGYGKTGGGTDVSNAKRWSDIIGKLNNEKGSYELLTAGPPENRNRKDLKTHSWECKICGSKIRGKRSNLLRHIRNIHEKVRPFQCSDRNCNQSFQSKSNLERHISSVHKRKTYSCNECTRTFKSVEAFETHARSAHSSRQLSYKCTICGGCFSSDSSLKRHSLLVHKI